MPETRPHIEIYTDGGCSPNPGPGGWAAILIHPQETRELSGGEPETTNNRMELTAAARALEALTQPCQIDFYTDSEYLRRGITEWLPGWIANGWRRGKSSDAPPVANADLWRAIAAAIRQHDIDWHWVKGHAGNPYNERADELASAAIPRPEATIDPDAARVYLRIAGGESGSAHGWAAALIRGTDTTILQGHSPADTPNHFVVKAAIAILEQIDPAQPVQFFTNSSYLFDGITTWVKGWRKKGWAKPDKFRDSWQTLDRLNQARQVEWVRFDNQNAPAPFASLKEPAETARQHARRR